LSKSESYKTDAYLSSDDSELLRKVLGHYSGDRCLEIGIGYGSNLLELKDRFFGVVGTDLTKTDGFGVNRGSDLVISDSGTCFRAACFDLVVLNPPYVPSDEFFDPTTDGGKFGFEVIERFLREATRLIKSRGRILLVFSSLNPMKKLVSLCSRLKLRIEVADIISVFFETLTVFEISRAN
jgi:methylase of polypeptide subunit release factors